MKTEKLVAILRIAMGWMFAYAGLSKIMDPAWSAAGYLTTAKTFTALYAWLASPTVLPYINWVNKWALLLLGVSLILGLFVKLSTLLGSLLMALYYIPVLMFPYVGKNYFLVDDHIIFILVLLLLGAMSAGRTWGLETWCSGLPICSKYPRFRKLLG